MIIAVNTRLLLKNKLTGLGHFTHETLKVLVSMYPQHTFLFLFDRPWDNEFIFADNIIPIQVFPQARSAPLYYWWFEYSVPRILKKYKADIFISMDNFYSLSLDIPGILVIHDLAYLHYPDHIDKLHLYYYRRFTPLFVRKATQIATVSEYTAHDILNHFEVSKDKINVVNIGLNQGIQKIEEKTQIIEYLKSKKIFHKYFLHVGTFQPRKNVSALIAAFDIFRTQSHEHIQLVLTGDKGRKSEAMYDAYEASPYKEDILILGYQRDEALSYLLSGAEALFLVSLFEGFGLPIIEAQKCGCPVVTSEVSSMPEAAGGAALLINPESVDSIAAAMERIVNDDELKKELINKGYQNITQYSWEKTAQNIWQIVQKISKDN